MKNILTILIFLLSFSSFSIEEIGTVAPLAEDTPDISEFGSAIAMSGNLAVIGDPDFDHGEEDIRGAVFVFQNVNGTWTSQTKILAPELTNENFGFSVAIDGNHLVVGDPDFYEIGEGTDYVGKIYIYERIGNNWSLVAGDPTELEGDSDSKLGTSVAISGTRVVAGAPDKIPSGEIRIYDTNANLLFTKTTVSANKLGSTVDIKNNLIAAGDYSFSNNRGQVVIFKQSTGPENWIELTNIQDPGATDNNKFGFSLNFDNTATKLIVGSPGSSSTGVAYILDQDQGGTENWGPVTTFSPRDGVTGDEFGYSVSLESTTAVIGSPKSNSNNGAVYTYYLENGTWDEFDDLFDDDSTNGNFNSSNPSSNFGESLAFNGSSILVGQPSSSEVFYNELCYKLHFFDPIAGTTFTGDVDQKVVHGESATAVKANPVSGYLFIEWQDENSNRITVDPELVVTNVTQNQQYEAYFTYDDGYSAYPINFLAGNGGTIDGVSPQNIEDGEVPGDSEPVTALPNEGYSFFNWTDSTSTIVSTNPTFTATSVRAIETYKANFIKDEYVIKFQAGENGTIQEGDLIEQTLSFKSASTPVTAIPNDGFMLINWTNSLGVEVSIEEALIIESVESEEIYTANFGVRVSKLEFLSTEGGNIAPSEIQEITYNEPSIPVTATPMEGYQLENWTNSLGEVVSEELILSIANVLIDEKYTANFKTAEYTLTLQYGDTDGVNSSSDITILHDGSYTFTASPQTNYKIKYITVNGEAIAAASGSTSSFTYTLNNITEDTVVSIVYDTLSDSFNLYKLYNTVGDYYYFTTSSSEYRSKGLTGEWIQYGITGKIYNGPQVTSGRTAVPYYVAKNTSTGEYFYSNTTSDFPSGYTSQGTLGYIYASSVSNSNELYRLYNSATNKYCWTSDSSEYNELTNNGWIASGTIMHMVKGPTPNLPTPTARYHAFSLFTLEHYYTTSETEYNNLGIGWIKVGIDHYVYSNSFSSNSLTSTAVYKFINPANNFHYWTGNSNEVSVRNNAGWTSFGIDFYLISSRYLTSQPLTRLNAGNRYVWSVDPLDVSASVSYGWSIDAIEGFAIPSNEYNAFLSPSQYPTIIHSPQLAALAPSQVPLVTLNSGTTNSGLNVSFTEDNSSSSTKDANYGVQQNLPVYLVVTEDNDYEVIFDETEEILEDVIILQENESLTHEEAIELYFQGINIYGIIKIN